MAFNPEGVNVAGITLSALIHICGSVPGLSRRSNPGLTLANAFGVICGFVPGLSRRSNPGLTLANTFGVICGFVPGLSRRSNPGLTLANAFGVRGQIGDRFDPAIGLIERRRRWLIPAQGWSVATTLGMQRNAFNPEGVNVAQA